jgi:hypothetical protein
MTQRAGARSRIRDLKGASAFALRDIAQCKRLRHVGTEEDAACDSATAPTSTSGALALVT